MGITRSVGIPSEAKQGDILGAAPLFFRSELKTVLLFIINLCFRL